LFCFIQFPLPILLRGCVPTSDDSQLDKYVIVDFENEVTPNSTLFVYRLTVFVKPVLRRRACCQRGHLKKRRRSRERSDDWVQYTRQNKKENDVRLLRGHYHDENRPRMCSHVVPYRAHLGIGPLVSIVIVVVILFLVAVVGVDVYVSERSSMMTMIARTVPWWTKRSLT
jgi:hypothetical protein